MGGPPRKTCPTGTSVPTVPVAPSPIRYEIKRIEKIGKHTIAMVIYPDCTNYEGKKILVFLNKSEATVLSWAELDPHFRNDSKSPDIRFNPRGPRDGMQMAEDFVRAYDTIMRKDSRSHVL